MAPATDLQTILVVEDDDATRIGMGEILSGHGYRAALVANGREAIDYLRDYPEPNLIILDMVMPGMDGWRFLRERGFHWRSIPVIITTGLGGAGNGWGVTMGVADVLGKPIDMEDMLRRVHRCLE
jgi:CheY-like chemotaxis protein